MWQDVWRSYQLCIDGKQVAKVGNGEEITVPVAPGAHRVQMKVDWCASEPLIVHVEDEETHVLECGPNANPMTALLYISLWMQNYLWLRPVSTSPSS